MKRKVSLIRRIWPFVCHKDLGTENSNPYHASDQTNDENEANEHKQILLHEVKETVMKCMTEALENVKRDYETKLESVAHAAAEQLKALADLVAKERNVGSAFEISAINVEGSCKSSEEELDAVIGESFDKENLDNGFSDVALEQEIAMNINELQINTDNVLNALENQFVGKPNDRVKDKLKRELDVTNEVKTLKQNLDEYGIDIGLVKKSIDQLEKCLNTQAAQFEKITGVMNGKIAQNTEAIVQFKDNAAVIRGRISQLVEITETNDRERIQLKANMKKMNEDVAQLNENVESITATLSMLERRVYFDSHELFLMIHDIPRDLAFLRNNTERSLGVMWRMLQYSVSSSMMERALTEQVRRSYFNAYLTTDRARGQRYLNLCLQELCRCRQFDRTEVVYSPVTDGNHNLTVTISQQGMGGLEVYLAGSDGQVLFIGATNAQGVPGGFSRIVTLQRRCKYWIEERRTQGEAQVEWCVFTGHLIR